MLYSCFTSALPLSIQVSAAILLYCNIYIYSYFTPTLLVLFLLFVCVCMCVCVCVCASIYALLLLYSRFTYNIYNIYIIYMLVFGGLQCCWWRGSARIGVSCVTRLVYCNCVW